MFGAGPMFDRMIFVHSSAVCRALFILLCGVFLALPPAGLRAAPGKTVEPRNIPEELLLPKEAPDGVADRKELLGELYLRLKKTEDADSAGLVASAIEKLWQRSGSDTVDLLMNRVSKLMDGKELDIALQLLNSVTEIAPDYSEGWNQRAAILFVKKDFSKSLESLRHALALDPSHYKAIQGLGLLMQELGDKKAALKAFRHALSVHPHLEDVRQSERELSREVEGQGI
jgi:tetratricopeptide (TPR) repeat protein